MKFKAALLATVIIVTLSACRPAMMKPLGNPERPYPPPRQPVVGDILHLSTGMFVSAQSMLEQASRFRVIFVGETHDNPASHRLQETLLKALDENNRGRVTLAMEMFTPAQQPVLDRWTAGALSEKEFLKQVDWYGSWRMNFAYYRKLLVYCRDHNIPVLALNAENELKRKVARMPFDQLPAQDRQQLPDIDRNDPYHQATVAAFYAGHDMGRAMQEGFARVQLLWDETMAQNLADYLRPEDPQRQVLVVAGGNHIRYGFGIPRRLFRRIPVSYVLIGSEELDVPEDKRDRLMDVDKPDYPMPPYHFLTYTAYEDLAEPGVKLGIMLERDEAGLRIKAVTPDSIAARNDLRENDVLTRMDEQKLVEPFDLIYELQQTKAGASVVLTLQRHRQTLTKTITFPETTH